MPLLIKILLQRAVPSPHSYVQLLVSGCTLKCLFYSMGYNPILSFCCKLLQLWPLGAPSGWLLCRSDKPHPSLHTSSCLALQAAPGSSRIFSAPVLWNSHFSKEPWFPRRGGGLFRNKDLGSRDAHGYMGVGPHGSSGSLSEHSKEARVGAPAHLIYLYLCTYVHVCRHLLSIHPPFNTEFTQIRPILIQYHKARFSLPPC